MIEARIVGPETREAWNRCVDRCPDSIAWHVYEWSDVVVRHYDYEFLPVAAFERNEVVGVLQLYRGAKALISVPYVVAGGRLETMRSSISPLCNARSRSAGSKAVCRSR